VKRLLGNVQTGNHPGLLGHDLATKLRVDGDDSVRSHVSGTNILSQRSFQNG